MLFSVAPIRQVEHFGHGLDAAGLLEGLVDHGRQPVLQPALHLLDHLRVGLLHRGDPLDDLDLLGRRQPRQDLRGLHRLQVRQDQGDGLRVLVLDERQQVVAFRFLQK